jgi:hypothetical protein
MIRSILSAIGKVLLVLAFYGLFMPAGFVMRLLRGDPLHRQFDDAADSYYQASKQRADDHMNRPY